MDDEGHARIAPNLGIGADINLGSVNADHMKARQCSE
jgi:hypothetical protein